MKIAVIGLTVGRAHIKDYLNNQKVSEIVICDINEERLNAVGNEFNIPKRYTDYKEMLKNEKPEGVSVCVSNFLHREVCLACFEEGANVLCEKPLGRNEKECTEIIEAANYRGKKLTVNFNRRYSPEINALKKIIDEGMLGSIYFAKTHWKRQRGVPWWFPLNNTKERCGGGAFIDLGVHMLDSCLWLCNYPKADWVLGKTYCAISEKEAKERGFEGFDAEDMGIALITFENSLSVETEISWASNREEENDEIYLRLYGTKGGAVLRHSVNEKGFVTLQKTLTLTDEKGNPFVKELEAKPCPTVRDVFINHILSEDSISNEHEALEIAKIIDGVYLSSKENRPVKL